MASHPHQVLRAGVASWQNSPETQRNSVTKLLSSNVLTSINLPAPPHSREINPKIGRLDDSHPGKDLQQAR